MSDEEGRYDSGEEGEGVFTDLVIKYSNTASLLEPGGGRYGNANEGDMMHKISKNDSAFIIGKELLTLSRPTLVSPPYTPAWLPVLSSYMQSYLPRQLSLSSYIFHLPLNLYSPVRSQPAGQHERCQYRPVSWEWCQSDGWYI